MNFKKIRDSVNNIKTYQSILDCGHVKNVVRKSKEKIKDSSIQKKLMDGFIKVNREKPSNITFEIDENGVICYSNPFCKHCYSNKVKKHSYNWKLLINEQGEHIIIKVKRYYCSKCGKYSQVEFEEQYAPYCNFSNETKEKAILLREKGSFPFRNMSDFYKIFNNISISHETVRQSQIITDEPYYLNKEIKPSGFYSYDVQWEPIDGKYVYRHLLFDIVNNAPLAELLSHNEELKTTYNFINKSVKNQDRKAIVTDLKNGYDSVMHKLGFEHQKCTFHLKLGIFKKIKTYLKEIENKTKYKIKEKDPEISNYKLNKIIKKELKEIKKEINEYLILIFELFNQQTYDKAVQFINLLKHEYKNFPDILKDFLNDKIFPEYKYFILFLKKSYKGKITKTNNPSEMYFRATLPRAEKNKYRTFKGLINQILHRKNGWMKNQKLQLTN